jgi:hypothetical protein
MAVSFGESATIFGDFWQPSCPLPHETAVSEPEDSEKSRSADCSCVSLNDLVANLKSYAIALVANNCAFSDYHVY